MDHSGSASRVLKISQDDMKYNALQQPQRKFNVIPAPISRPPSAHGNKATKVQKIKPNPNRKRLKWNDRFHIETEEQKQSQSASAQGNKHFVSEKKKCKTSSIIPPFDVVTGKRQWGKRNKKRTKWSMRKNKTTHRSRAKWNKPKDTKDTKDIKDTNNILSLSRSRVLPLPTKSTTKSTTKLKRLKDDEQKEPNDENSNMCLNKHQKEEIAKLFSECFKTMIQNVDEHPIEKKKENEEIHHDTNVETELCHKSVETTDCSNIEIQNNERVKKELLPINTKDKLAKQERKSYLKPLDKVADIILNDLIEQVSQELDAFCSQVVDTLIQSETNMP